MVTVRILRQSSSMPSKIQAIKEIRMVSNLGLKEAKDLIESLPATLDVPASTPPEHFISLLISYGYDAEIDNGLSHTANNTEKAFKMFLIALINEGEYEQVVTFIKTKRTGSVAGQPGRNLEPL